MAKAEVKNISYVYEHWRTDRQECFYVGKGKGRRAYTMARRNRHHQAIVAKLHRTGYAVEIKIVASGLSDEEAFYLEIERISFWKEMGADLTNMTNGGDAPPVKVGKENPFYGKKHTEETKDKISFCRKGSKQSNETKAKISAIHKANGLKPPVFYGENHPMYGKTHSDVAKNKVSAANKGRKSWLGKTHSAETRAKLSKIAKMRHASVKGTV